MGKAMLKDYGGAQQTMLGAQGLTPSPAYTVMRAGIRPARRGYARYIIYGKKHHNSPPDAIKPDKTQADRIPRVVGASAYHHIGEGKTGE